VGKNRGTTPGHIGYADLKAVSLKPLHGYGVLLRIRQISRMRLRFHRILISGPLSLEHHDLIAAEWGQSENNAGNTTP